MRFLADENIERPIVMLLRSLGHDVSHIAEDSPGIDDDHVLRLAESEGRILLTNDKDFGELAFRGGRVTAGVVLIRLGQERTASKLIIIEHLLAKRLDLLRGHFTVVGRSRLRRRSMGTNH